jgi:hypothetical protein
MTVFAAENVRDWRGKLAIDPSGAKIGELEAGVCRHGVG